MKVTEENMDSVFNDTIYPSLKADDDLEKQVQNIKNILRQYTFEDEQMQVRFLIPCLETLGKCLQKEMKIEELSRSTRNEIGWYNVQNWFNDGNFIPMKLINYADILNSESKDMWKSHNVIDVGVFEWVQKEAEILLEMVKNKEADISTKQKNHLKKIVDGKIPFGLKLAK